MLASVQIPLLFFVALSALMLWVVLSDTIYYVISNRLNALVMVLYIPAAFLLPIVDPLWAPLASVIVLVVGLGFFALGLMGGGDVKLLAVLSLWTGWGIATLQFIMLTTLFGGALVLVVLPMRVLLPGLWLKLRPGKPLPRVLTRKQPVPYGIAVAFAFSYMLWAGMVPGLLV